MHERIRAAIAILVALPIAAGLTALGAGCQDVSFHLASRTLEDLDAGTSARAGAAGSGGGAGVATGGRSALAEALMPHSGERRDRDSLSRRRALIRSPSQIQTSSHGWVRFIRRTSRV